MVLADGPHAVIPGVLAWAAFSPAHKVELRSHAVATGEGWLVLDPIPLAAGWPDGLGPVRAVILTNGNHGRAADAWSARGIPVWAPAGVEIDDARVTRRHGEADGFPPDALPVALPGGAPGETAWWFPRISLVAFGDAVVNLEGRGLELLPDRYCTDSVRLRRSIRTRLPERFANAVFAHGTPLIGDADRRVTGLAG